jgi:hypothetical protein
MCRETSHRLTRELYAKVQTPPKKRLGHLVDQLKYKNMRSKGEQWFINIAL